MEEVRSGRLSEEERALERDYNSEGRASGDDREGDDRWLPRHSPPQDLQVLPLPQQVVHSCQCYREETDSFFWRSNQPEAWQAPPCAVCGVLESSILYQWHVLTERGAAAGVNGACSWGTHSYAHCACKSRQPLGNYVGQQLLVLLCMTALQGVLHPMILPQEHF